MSEVQRLWEKIKSLGERMFTAAAKASDGTSGQNVVVCYFIKQQNIAHAIWLLLDRQMIQEAQILLRCQIENMIYLAASTREPNFKELFESQNLLRRSKVSKAIIQYSTNSGGVPDVNIEKEREKIKEEIAKLAVKGLDIERLAKKYSMLAEYFYIYECCNAEVHSLPSAIREYFDQDKNEFVHYPGLDEYDSTCVGFLLCYLERLS